MFRRDDRVLTPFGEGTIAFVRMGGPTYSTPEAVSVVLDMKRDKPGYSGTIFSVDKIKKLEE